MSGYECSMVCHKLYSEISPTEELKEGVAVGEEVEPDDGATVGRNDGTVEGRNDGTVVGLEDGAGMYSQPQLSCSVGLWSSHWPHWLL